MTRIEVTECARCPKYGEQLYACWIDPRVERRFDTVPAKCPLRASDALVTLTLDKHASGKAV